MPPIPLDKQQVLDLYFLEHRAKLLDLAAFLDRYDRAGGAGEGQGEGREGEGREGGSGTPS